MKAPPARRTPDERSILIVGGTGEVGRATARTLLALLPDCARRLIIASRDEARAHAVVDGGATRVVHGFSPARTVLFVGERRARRVYHFDFSDQHTLRRTLGVNDISTTLAIESRAVTALVAALAKPPFRRLFALDALRKRVARWSPTCSWEERPAGRRLSHGSFGLTSRSRALDPERALSVRDACQAPVPAQGAR